MLRVLACLFAATLPAVATAAAQPACLPAAVFAADGNGRMPSLDLGFVGAVPTLCARDATDRAALIGCWTVNPARGALTAAGARALPGHGRRAVPDTAGCTEGYCVAPSAETRLLATSTDGAHAVVLADAALHVFDAATKARTARIPLADPAAPDHTNVSNTPIKLLYAADTIYVVGSDAGPFIGVWAFKQDGRRLGLVKISADPASEAFNIFNGGINIVDGTDIALADAGLQTMLFVSVATSARQRLKRAVSPAPCTRKHMQSFAEGDLSLPPACRNAIRARFEPYLAMSALRLANGDVLTTLTGPAHGQLALLAGRTLAERKRIQLLRCRS